MCSKLNKNLVSVLLLFAALLQPICSQAAAYTFRSMAPGLVAAAPTPVTHASAGISLVNLLAYYPLQSSYTDVAGGFVVNQTKTFTPTFTTDTPFAVSKNTLSLDGTQAFYSASGPISGTGDYSLGAWIKPASLSGVIVQQRDADNIGEFMYLLNSNGTLCYMDYPNGTNGSFSCSTHGITAGSWHFVSLTRQGTSLKFYIDGTLDKTVTTAPASSIATACGLSIGYDQRVGQSYFMGQLSDLFIFNRALSNSEMSQIYSYRAPLQ